MNKLKFKVGDRVRIKSIDWYNANKDENGDIPLIETTYSSYNFIEVMRGLCGKVMTISSVYMNSYNMVEDDCEYFWTDEMIEGLVERNGKIYPYKIGDRVVLKGNNRCATITDLKYNSWGNLSYYIKIDNDKDISIDYPTDLLLPYDNMIEGLAEEETKPKFKVGDRVIVRDMSGIWEITNVEDDILYTIKRENHTFTLTTYGSFLTLYEGISDKKEEMKSEDSLLDEYEELTDRAFKGGYEKCQSDIELNGFQLPEGYIFKDENGNEILTNKIILEKKKKEYPKTYEECCKVMNYCYNPVTIKTKYKEDLIRRFQFLLMYRDAYWKIAGEELGLGKPWSPNDSPYVYCIYAYKGEIFCDTPSIDCVLMFPTAEMRDAFYENFKKEIEICKELL